MINTADFTHIEFRLEKVRLYLNLDQNTFLDELNLSQKKYESIIAGELSLPPKLALLLNRNYQISIKWLIEGKGEMRTLIAENKLCRFHHKPKKQNPNRSAIPTQFSKGKKMSVVNETSNKNKFEKELFSLEERIDQTLLDIRRTLLSAMRYDTFDDHKALKSEFQELKILFSKSRGEISDELIDAYNKLKHQVNQESASLLKMMESGFQELQKNNVISLAGESADTWQIYKNSVN